MSDYHSFKKNIDNAPGYKPKGFGKVALWITVPACAIALVSVIVAFFYQPAMIVALVAFALTIIGCIMISIDIIIYNRKQKAEDPNYKKEPKKMDIGRIVHMAIGIIVGIIIGYLIWGMKTMK